MSKKPVPCGPRHRPYNLFSGTTHGVLRVWDEAPGAPQPENMDLSVLDGFNGTRTPLSLRSTDTTDMLIERYLQVKPRLGGELHLVFNGKLLPKARSLGELGVKPGAVFITYQKCTGG